MADRMLCNAIVEREVADELGLSLAVVKRMVSAQSELVKETMESGTFDPIRLCHLGVFKSKPKMVQIINHMKGLTPEQQTQLKRDIKSGRIKFNLWEKKKKDTKVQK